MLLTEIFIDTRRKTIKGFPVKLQIYCTLSHKRKYIPLKIYQTSRTKVTQEAQEALSKLITRLEPLKDLPLDVAFPMLQKEGDLEILAMRHKLEQYTPVVIFTKFAQKLISEKEIQGMSTEAYKAVIREIDSYVGGDFNINDINYNWLKDYQMHKVKKGTGQGGISYYLRSMRAIYNEAVRRDIGVKDTKPFRGMITTATSAKHDLKQYSIEDVKYPPHQVHLDPYGMAF